MSRQLRGGYFACATSGMEGAVIVAMAEVWTFMPALSAMAKSIVSSTSRPSSALFAQHLHRDLRFIDRPRRQRLHAAPGDLFRAEAVLQRQLARGDLAHQPPPITQADHRLAGGFVARGRAR